MKTETALIIQSVFNVKTPLIHKYLASLSICSHIYLHARNYKH